LALGGAVLLLAAAPISARKIKIESDYDNQYPRKVLKDLRKKVDDLMTRTLKSLPPPSAPK
jgi:hypothetical protein